MKQLILFLLVIHVSLVQSQDVELPRDFRQHNLTNYNSSIFNPANSLYGNDPESVAIWMRWQWQSIDTDPTTYFLSYSRAINPESAFSVGFFQHNTGIFLQTGGVLNYSYSFKLSDYTELILGANVFGYQNKLADDRFIQDPDMILPIPPETNDFILQFAPGVLLLVNNFSIGLTSDNLVDYNFESNESQTDGTSVLMSVGYDFPVNFLSFDDNAYLRPVIYFKSIPNRDSQIGLNAILSSSKFWAQAGYNNFYGLSVGGGGRFFKKLSLGALVEAGTSSDLDGLDPTIELVAAFSIAPQTEKEIRIEPKEEPEEEPEELITEDEKSEEELAAAAELARRQEEERKAEEARKAKELEEERIAQARIAREKEAERRAEEARLAREQFIADSISAVRLAEAEAARKQAEIAKAAEEEKPQAGEKYQEITSEDGLRPGFYLVANVFGTKRYYEAFMKTLADMGIEPKSFYRSVNKYNYVYLERYDTMREARQARDSQYNGRYKGDTWIFRVVGN